MKQFVRGNRYPIWSTRIILMISLPVLVTITALVFVLSDRSVFVETEITLLIISLCLFAFFAAGLYQGVRLERPDRDRNPVSTRISELGNNPTGPQWSDLFNVMFWLSPPDLSQIRLPHVDLSRVGLPDSGDDLVGCLVTLVLWIVMLIALVFLLWVLSQVIAALPVLALAVAFTEEVLFRGILQALFKRSLNTTRALVAASLFFALWHLVVNALSLQQNMQVLPSVLTAGAPAIAYLSTLIAVGIGGGILSILRERTDHLAGSIVVHWIADAAMTIVLYLQ